MLTAWVVLVLGGLLATTTEALARCDTCVLWNGVLFWSGVLAFYLLLGIICCAEIALHSQGPRRICVIFGCICAAILAALFYATNPSYMLWKERKNSAISWRNWLPRMRSASW